MRWISLLAIMALAQPLAAIDFDGQWTHQKFPLKKSVEYSLTGSKLGIKSEGGVSLIYRKVFEKARSASWNWQVSASVPATNLRQKGGDDRNMAIYFVFMPEAAAEAARDKGLVKLLGDPNAKALVYSYGGKDARGARFNNPYMAGRGTSIVLAPSGAGGGAETVDLAGDFAKAFGEAPDVLVGIGITADSDDTKSRIEASVSNLTVR